MAKKNSTAKTGATPKASKPRSGTRAKAPSHQEAAAAVAANPVVMPATPTHEQIAQRAYEIWLSKGQPVGQDYQNWVEAVGQLTGGRG